jgi:hypothetical protein
MNSVNSDEQSRFYEFSEDWDESTREGGMREFWLHHAKEHGIQETVIEMYNRAPGFKEGPDKALEELEKFDEYLDEFPTIDVAAFAIYRRCAKSSSQVIEEIGGIDKENFYYMYENTEARKYSEIPFKRIWSQR